MISFVKKTSFVLAEAEIPYNLVRAAREVGADSTKIYDISKIDTSPVELKLVGQILYAAMIAALNPAKSLPVLVNTIMLTISQASLRMDELYHEIAGLSEYPGSDPNAPTLGIAGIERKLRLYGRELVDQVEVFVSAGGTVTANHPIHDMPSVSARKPGGSLLVTGIANLQLGVVALNDGGFPIADGITVELVYAGIRHCVCVLQDSNPNRSTAVLMSKELFDYLTANI